MKDKKFSYIKCEIGYFNNTLLRWYEEGLPTNINIEEFKKNIDKDISSSTYGNWGPVNLIKYKRDEDVLNFFNFGYRTAAVPIDFSPFKYQKNVEETNEFKIYYDEFGVKKKDIKGHVSMPLFLEFPVKNRNDFEKIKSFYSSNFEDRLYKDWIDVVRRYKEKDYKIWLYNKYWGFFGFLRQLMGLENLSLMFFDNPKFIHEIIEFFTGYIMRFWNYILEKINVDYILIWEDMAYNKTSLISPDMFKEFLLPYYKKFTTFLKKIDKDITIFVDSDGNISNLIPLWIEGGVDGIYPMECNAGMDIIKVRKDFPDLIIGGGVSKSALSKTIKDIDSELEKVECVLKTGRYVPFVDHDIPNNIPWKSFKYYREKLNLLIDKYNKK